MSVIRRAWSASRRAPTLALLALLTAAPGTSATPPGSETRPHPSAVALGGPMPHRGEWDALPPRQAIELADDWRTAAFDTGAPAPAGVLSGGFDDNDWSLVSVPHNWDGYEGFRQVRHGDRHGTAWYRRTFEVPGASQDRRVFLFFEGVGSYATVWVNGREVGRHAGGLTTFTVDVTDALQPGRPNLLVVRADHPAGIRDLPWVCGGCERAYGFSEGTQPMGIFRPVHVVTTAPVRIEPFGVHVWNEADLTPAAAQVHVRTELKNYGAAARTVQVVTTVRPDRQAALVPDRSGQVAQASAATRSTITLQPGETASVAHEPPAIVDARLWSPSTPYLYTLVTEIRDDSGQLLDVTETPFGIRTIRWPDPAGTDARFLVNGEQVFLNGICDYEHNLGNSHAFTDEQIHARVRQMQAAGFNAFRDAHHPHNLRFHPYWDGSGMLWWTQFGAHAWFDNDAFRTNFKTLLREWVKERRNSPSLVLWGIQNESMLPTEFAEECSAIIRELDPTASEQRKITTCNGGTGTDWDVPQNWSGTYSGNLEAYADDLRRQKLVGEYGAWRSLGLHTEGGFRPQAPYSEERMTALMETKVRLAETVRNEVAGHFMWPFTTHSNPGRNVGELGEQLADGFRPLDRISPANNKGLLTLWGEPLDVFYMYRANYAPPETQPMVYIASHTWPDRWTTPGRKEGIVVYSNCEEVELFNDMGERSLGRRSRGARGTHFRWEDVEVLTNVLYAEGRIAGKVVARDLITLHHLPDAPRLAALQRAEPSLTAARADREYLLRVNCGGPDYRDEHGNLWLADRAATRNGSWGWTSWAHRYPYLDPRFGSVRRVYDPVIGARDDGLFQTFRYGRDELRYSFPVTDGEYELELYFIEPWYGVNAGALDAPRQTRRESQRWRVFDVAINGTTVIRDLDLVAETGDRARALKRTVRARAEGGRLVLSFPRVAAGQAVISAIALSRSSSAASTPARSFAGEPAYPVESLTVADSMPAGGFVVRHALDTGDRTYSDAPGAFHELPPELLEATWLQPTAAARHWRGTELVSFRAGTEITVFVAHADPDRRPDWLSTWENTDQTLRTMVAPTSSFTIYRKPFRAGATVSLGANADAAGPSAAPMYLAFVVPQRPAAPPQTVQAAQPSLRVTGNLRAGREVYADADVRIRSLPGNLSDCDLVSPPSDGSADVRFTVADHVEVYVAYDPRIATLPDWLDHWAPLRDTVATTHPLAPKFSLVRLRYTPDQIVQLGRNGTLADGGRAAMYFVIVRPVRPSVFLEAEQAELVGTSAGAFGDASGTSAVVLAPGETQSITWTVPVGVGDRYGLSFRYTAATPAPSPVTGELTIIGADGRVLRTDPVEFPSVEVPRRWQFMRTRTGASINAGTYQFRLKLNGDTPLILDSLEVE